MKEVEVIKPSKVVRTDYLNENLTKNLSWLVNQTKELDKEHGKPEGSLNEGDVVTLQCVVHDSTIARLLMMPILQSHNGGDPLIGLSVPGMDVELAVHERLSDIVKPPETTDNEVIVNFLKGKLSDIEELKHQSDPKDVLPKEQRDFLMNFDNAEGAEKLIQMFIDELSSSN
ncbi:MAG: hypothetical protein CL582_00785 [Alteromonadaceae bacterium]|nr:hypothetical protein [Alteromonadaceae bacterium]